MVKHPLFKHRGLCEIKKLSTYGQRVVRYSRRICEREKQGLATWRAKEWLWLTVQSHVDRPTDSSKEKKVGLGLKHELVHKTNLWFHLKTMTTEIPTNRKLEVLVLAMTLYYRDLASFLFTDEGIELETVGTPQDALDGVRMLYAACVSDQMPPLKQRKLIALWAPLQCLALQVDGDYTEIEIDPELL